MKCIDCKKEYGEPSEKQRLSFCPECQSDSPPELGTPKDGPKKNKQFGMLIRGERKPEKPPIAKKPEPGPEPIPVTPAWKTPQFWVALALLAFVGEWFYELFSYTGGVK